MQGQVKYSLVLVLFLLCLYSHAQTADSTITITTTTDAVYKGKLVEEAPERYVRIQGADGRITRITFTMMQHMLNAKGDTLFVNKALPAGFIAGQGYIAPKPPDVSPPDSLFTTLAEYGHWNKVLLINGKDTVYVKASPGDYSAPNGKMFGGYALQVVYRNGIKKKLPQYELKEVISFDVRGDMTRYNTIWDSGQVEVFCRLLIDGKCQLYYNQSIDDIPVTGGAAGLIMQPNGTFVPNSMPNNATQGTGTMDFTSAGTTYTDNYYVYYKNELWPINSKSIFTPFKAMAREAFADCPALIKKIEDKIYTVNNLELIVKEFNYCIK